jgi:hypothetical protein
MTSSHEDFYLMKNTGISEECAAIPPVLPLTMEMLRVSLHHVQTWVLSSVLSH